jgi:hypothetical protein
MYILKAENTKAICQNIWKTRLTCFQAVRCAEITLLAGFTTVRDLGGTGVNISIRNAINKGVKVQESSLQESYCHYRRTC